MITKNTAVMRRSYPRETTSGGRRRKRTDRKKKEKETKEELVGHDREKPDGVEGIRLAKDLR